MQNNSLSLNLGNSPVYYSSHTMITRSKTNNDFFVFCRQCNMFGCPHGPQYPVTPHPGNNQLPSISTNR